MFSRNHILITVFSLLILQGCSNSPYNTGFSYNTDNKVNFRNTRSKPGSPRLIFSTNAVNRTSRISDKKSSGLKTGTFESIGPVLNKYLAHRTINSYRTANGLKPLRIDPKLELAARQHSLEMARLDGIFHTDPSGNDPWTRAEKQGYKPEMATENLGAGQPDFNQLMALWRASDQHNANLLVPDATDMGLSLVHDDKTKLKTFWTLVIAKKKPTSYSSADN